MDYPDEAEFTVRRAHWGDRRDRNGKLKRYRFQPGETRHARPDDVVDQVRFKVLEPKVAAAAPATDATAAKGDAQA